MDQKNLNFIVATCTFVLGAVFVLANPRDITANVIGASGPGATLTVVIGIVMIIASCGLFMYQMNNKFNRSDTRIEQLAREGSHHEEIKSKMDEEDIEEKYKDK